MIECLPHTTLRMGGSTRKRANCLMSKDLVKRDEDLFKETTMTFGEHLEELRTCLFKALAGLVVGFVVGLYFGGDVVEFIQTPLENALTAYYQKQTRTEIEEQLDALREAGYQLPEDAADRKKLVEDFIDKRNLRFEEVFVFPREVLRQLKRSNPEQFQDVPLPEISPDEYFNSDELALIHLWRSIDEDVRVTNLGAPEPFLIYIKASLLVGVLLASPWIFYQIWIFVASGLYGHERKYVHIFLPFSLALFFAGAALAFFFVFGPVLKFLFYFNSLLGIEQEIRISEWLGFVIVLPLGFGISFQLPLVMLFLERIGIFDVEAYVTKWRIAILVIAVLSMFLTPADPTSMLLMGVPLTVLYFGGILLCKYLPRSRSPYSDLDE